MRRGYRVLDEELEALTNLQGMGLNHEFNDETGEWSIHTAEGLTHADLVEQYRERTNRLNAVASVYQRADRIITGEEVTVTVINDKEMETNARSNGKDIELNSLLVEDLTDESIISLHGVNYHELAHVLFSPRQGSNLGIYARDNGLFRALSILEEGRSEQLLSARYPAIRPFLEASIYTYLLAEPSTEWGGKFHLITGRTYLPIELRQTITDKAIKQYGYDVVAEVHSCIHEYRNLVFPADFDKAKAIAHRLANIVGYDEQQTPQGGVPQPDSGTCGMPSKGRPAGTKEQESLQNQSKGAKVEKVKKPESSTNPEPHIGVGGDGVSQTDQDPDTELTDEDSQIAKAMNERLEQIKNDGGVKREVRDTRNAIIDSDEARVSIPKGHFSIIAPSQEAIVTAKRFSTELERLVRNNDPAWLNRVRSGRLNISRTMNPDVNAIAEAFDQWDIGNEATDIEAVILTDNSGSMGGAMRTVCENTWIIKRAIESINGSVTAFSFDSDTESLYEAKDKAKPNEVRFVNSRGSTNPLRGIIEANRILSATKKSIKLLFIVTDGEWERTEQCDSIIKSMNEKGILTCVVFLGGYQYYKETLNRSLQGDENATRQLKNLRHNARVFHAVAGTRDILKVATELVKSTLKKVA